MIRLSIVIPAFNSEPYLSELLDCLAPQITDEVEVIVIDDGSRQQVRTDHEWCKVIRQKNKGCSSARNKGIDKARGQYISFIDSDDLVSKDFILKILEKTKCEDFDVIELSWKSLTDKMWRCDHKLMEGQRLPNPSVCTRVFSRAFIGSTRFNTKKDSTEDEDFSRRLGYLDHETEYKVGIITDYLYFYRDDVPQSKTKKYAEGLMNTKRVIYYYEHVTKDMTWLIDEIKKDDEVNEVQLMTHSCELPELSRWCRIIKPQSTWAHIIKGEPNSWLKERKPPLRTQVVIYRKHINTVGGMRTFTKQFIEYLGDKYDITILCRSIEQAAYFDFIKKVRVITDAIKAPNGRLTPIDLGGSGQTIACDSLIVLSFLDPMPGNVVAGQKIRMCHACKTSSDWEIPKDYDRLVYVSRTAMESFGVKDGEVLHNLNKAADHKALILVSATRMPAPDKGDVERRMRQLSKMLNDNHIEHVWLNYASGKLSDPPANFYNMGSTEMMPQIIKAADYLVQLSDSECWSYSCLEALMAGTALICTPFPSTKEMGIIDGINAHVVPFDMDFDVHKLLDVPKFEYKYDNAAITKQWVQILGDTKPRRDYQPDKTVPVLVKSPYTDIVLNRLMNVGEVYEMREARARKIKAEQPWLIDIVGE